MKTCKGNNLHIIILGKRNAGKSTLINVLLGQDFSVVSSYKGTTTDSHEKSMELLPIGPVTLIDTAGFDDVDELGKKRVDETFKALLRADVAIFVMDYEPLSEYEKEVLKRLKDNNIKVLGVVNKNDIKTNEHNEFEFEKVNVSLLNEKTAKEKIINALIKIVPKDLITSNNLLDGILNEKEHAILVIPIDKEAPKDRLILPQVQVIRNILDKNGTLTITKTNELKEVLDSLKIKPKVVIVDSQAFKEVDKIVPHDIYLTSFSILFARLKGDLDTFIRGADKIDELSDNDKILIAESCTHHNIEDDIGTVKIPNLIKKYTNKNLFFDKVSGHDFPDDFQKYSLIIHCGGCMTNRIEILNRIKKAVDKNVPITNYGLAISKCSGILERSVEIFYGK